MSPRVFELLKVRLALATKLYIDLTPEPEYVGQTPVASFASTFSPANLGGTVPNFLDYDGINGLNATDIKLARKAIVERVQELFRPFEMPGLFRVA